MKIIVSIAIAFPAERVFALVSDYTRDPEWRTGVLEMSQMPPGPSQVGTQTLEVARFFGHRMMTPAEVTKYEPSREIHFAGLIAQQIRVSGSRRVEEVNGQARFPTRQTLNCVAFCGCSPRCWPSYWAGAFKAICDV
jgi:hypothetical protein